MRTVTMFTVFTLILLMTSLGFSQYAARESFIYPTTAKPGVDTIDGLGTATNGFAGSWTYDNGTKNIFTIGTVPMDYVDLAYPITNIGNHFTALNPGGWAAARYMRTLDKTWPNTAGATYWTSLIFQANGVPSGNTYYCFKLFSGSSELLAIGKSGGGTTYSAGSGWAGGTGDDVSSTVCDGTPVWLVTESIMSGGASCRTFMWINPDPTATTLDTNVADVKRWSGMPNGFDNVRLECGGADSMQTNWDEIRLGDSWASVSSPQYAARESFEYPTTAVPGVDTIDGLGTATNGFAGSWTYDNGTKNIFTIGTVPMDYVDLAYPITNIGNHFTALNPGGWAAARYMRTLDKTWPNTAGATYWTSLIFQANGVPSGNTYYCFKLFSGSSELLAIGKSGGGTTYSAGSGWAGGTGDDVSSTVCDGTPVWLVTESIMSGGASCRTFMWINPDPTATTLDTNVADVKRWSGMPNGFDNVRLECGGADSMQTNWDEIRLGTEYASVALPLAVTGVAKTTGNQPGQFALLQNYPNPFNPSTMISYTLKSAGNTRLAVYDVLGREVAVLVNGVQTTGLHTVPFSGARFASGIYFYRLESAGSVTTKKMMLLK